MTSNKEKTQHQAPYPCQTLHLFNPGAKARDFPMGGNDRSICGFNSECTIKNTTNFNIHVFAPNGDYITVIPPHIPSVAREQYVNYVTNVGIQVYYRKCLGSQIAKGRKPADEQEFYTRNFSIEEISDAPIYIPEAQIILAMEDHKTSITTFSECLNLILNGFARTKNGAIQPIPFCAYVNFEGMENQPKFMYYCFNKTTFLRVPVIQVDYLAPGMIFSRFELVNPDDTVSAHGLNTSFEDLMSEEGGGVAYCYCKTGDIVHFSFDLDLLRIYLDDEGNQAVEEQILSETIPPKFSEEECQFRIQAATTSLRQQNQTLTEELERVTRDRDQLLKDKADVERLADRAYSPGAFQKKKAEQEQERHEKRIKSKLSHCMDILKIIGAIGGICVALKDPIIWAYKTFKPFFSKTPQEAPCH